MAGNCLQLRYHLSTFCNSRTRFDADAGRSGAGRRAQQPGAAGKGLADHLLAVLAGRFWRAIWILLLDIK
jgi:hypothetical protein